MKIQIERLSNQLFMELKGIEKHVLVGLIYEFFSEIGAT